MSRQVLVYRPGHPLASPRGFVDVRDLDAEPPRALDAPIMVDRFYEGVRSPVDGSDIGSRQKHREHMHRHGLTTADDYTNTWKQAERERAAIREGTADRKERREQIGRAMYEHKKRGRR